MSLNAIALSHSLPSCVAGGESPHKIELEVVMDRIRGGSPQALRERNKRMVLERLLDASEGLTRPELARLVDLTVPTVASLVAGNGESLSAVLDETRAPEGSQRARAAGRRPMVLRVRESVGRVVGIVLNHNDIHVAIADLRGHYDVERHSQRQDWDVEHDLHGAIAQAVQTVQALAEQSNVQPEEIAAISVALSAPVHVYDSARPKERRGRLRVDLGPGSTSLWLNIDPLAAFTNHLAALPDGHRWSAIDLHVDNDANLGALAELKIGAGRGTQNLLYVRLHDAGIGAGLVIDGRNYRGTGGIAGEFGHVVVEPRGRAKCRHCGRSCVEVVVGALLGCRGSACDPPLAALVESALVGDPKSVRTLEKASTYIGRALASIITMLNLDRILIGGPFPAQAYRLIVPPMQAELDQLVISPVARDYVLGLGTLREDAVLHGAIWLALERTRVDYLIQRAFGEARATVTPTSSDHALKVAPDRYGRKTARRS